MPEVSVPSFGDSFFINFLCLNNEESISICFRPLIRGFFFYSVTLVKDDWNLVLTFPSPYSGILFLCWFYNLWALPNATVSVPLFGDSFFISKLSRR